MKNLLLGLCAFLLSFFSFSQTTWYYTGLGDVADVNNWDDGVNVNNHPASFSLGASVTFDLDAISGTIESNWNLTSVLTCSSGSSTLTIDDGVTVTMSSTSTFSSPSNITIQGTGSFTGALEIASTTDVPALTNVSIQNGSGALTAVGNWDIITLTTTANSNIYMGTNTLVVDNVTRTGGSTLIHTENTSATPVSAIVYPSGVLVQFDANGTQTIPSGIEFQGGVVLNNCDISLTENLDADVIVSMTGDATLDMNARSISGSATINGAGTSSVTTSNTGVTPVPANSTFYDLTYDGLSRQYIPSGITVSNDLILNSSADVWVSGDLNANAIVFQSSTELDLQVYQLTNTSSVSFTGTHTFKTGYVHASNNPYPDGLNFNNSNVSVVFDGAGNQIIPGGSVYNISFEGSGVKTMASGQTLTVGSSGGAMDIQPGIGVDVGSGEEIDFNGSTLTLHADATGYGEIRMQGTLGLINSPNFVKEFYLDLSSPRWFYMGTALFGASLQDLNEGETMISANDATGSVFAWDATTSEWTNPSLTGNSPEVGYAIYAGTLSGVNFLRSGSGVVTTEGTSLLTADAVIDLQYDNSGSSTTTFADATEDGWNLVANPYTASIDWDAQGFPGTMDNAVYIKDDAVGDFKSYVNDVAVNGGSRYIAPGQAFWVRAQNGAVGDLTLSVNNTAIDQSATFYKNVNVAYLKIESANMEHMDELAIRFDASATPYFDGNFDAYKLQNDPGHPNLYVSLNGDNYSICSTPDSISSFPVTFKANGYNSPLTITIDESQLTSYTTAVLEDIQTGTFTELTKGGTYSFTGSDTDPSNRFILHFNNSGIGVEEYLTSPLTFSLLENQLMIFQNGVSEMSNSQVQLIDMQGRVLWTNDVTLESNVNSFEVPTLSVGVYVVRAQINGEWVSQRVLKQ